MSNSRRSTEIKPLPTLPVLKPTERITHQIGTIKPGLGLEIKKQVGGRPMLPVAKPLSSLTSVSMSPLPPLKSPTSSLPVTKALPLALSSPLPPLKSTVPLSVVKALPLALSSPLPPLKSTVPLPGIKSPVSSIPLPPLKLSSTISTSTLPVAKTLPNLTPLPIKLPSVEKQSTTLTRITTPVPMPIPSTYTRPTPLPIQPRAPTSPRLEKRRSVETKVQTNREINLAPIKVSPISPLPKVSPSSPKTASPKVPSPKTVSPRTTSPSFPPSSQKQLTDKEVQEMCCVCADGVPIQQRLKCKHDICIDCMKQLQKPECPVCRKYLEGAAVTEDILNELAIRQVEEENKRETANFMVALYLEENPDADPEEAYNRFYADQ